MKFDLVLRFYQGSALRRWMSTLIGGPKRGGDLLHLVKGPDSVYTAERLLKAAEAEGLIERGNWEPTREMRFFGVGGLEVRKESSHSSAVEFAWSLTDPGREFLETAE